MVLTFCIGRETIQALEVGVPVQIGQGAVAIPADSYDAPYKRIAELEAAVLAAKVMLEPTDDKTEEAWQVLDQAYHQWKK